MSENQNTQQNDTESAADANVTDGAYSYSYKNGEKTENVGNGTQPTYDNAYYHAQGEQIKQIVTEVTKIAGVQVGEVVKTVSGQIGNVLNEVAAHLQNDFAATGTSVKNDVSGAKNDIINAGKQFKDEMRRAGDEIRKATRGGRGDYIQDYNTQWGVPTPKQKRPFCNRKVKHDKLIGGLLQGFGVFYGVVSLIAAIILLFTVSESFIPAIIAAAIFLIFNGMAKNGRSLSKRAKRFERYMEFIGNNKMCEISALANYIGKSVGFVKKDLKKMIEQGYFAQAYMDRERTCVFLDRAAFDAYMGVFEKPKAKPQTEEKPEEKPEAEPIKENANSDMMAEGRAAIEQLETLRSEIKSQTICEKIQKLENTAAKIFAYVGAHPNKAGEIRKLMRYYIPTTIKLLTTYREMEAQNISGETIEATMKDIDGVLTTIDTAFINLLDNMFRQDALDVAAEINVMNNMMAQEGLKKSDLEVSRESVKTAQSTGVKADEDDGDDIKLTLDAQMPIIDTEIKGNNDGDVQLKL